MSSHLVKRRRFEVVNDSDDGRSEASDASGAGATGLLHTLQGHIDDLRSLIHCGVCVRLLYEPFTLPCGHTFCYGCLAEWFPSQDNNKKTCPDCRAVVKAEPAPAYLIRNFVQIFIGRAELLEGGETTEQHLENQRVESAKVESDKNNNNIATGGLFRGCFKRPEVAPIIDAGDGVDRCPLCFWELEEDECNRCGYIDRNWESDTRLAEEEEDEEDEEDEEPVVLNRRARGVTDMSNSGDSNSESDDEESGSSEMASFIDDDDVRSVEADFSDISTSTVQDGYMRRSRSESFGGTDFWRGSSPFNEVDFMDNHHGYDQDDDQGDDGEDEDDEDEGPVGPAFRRVQRNFGRNDNSINLMMGLARNMHTDPFGPSSDRRLPGSHSLNPISLDSDSPHQPRRHGRILQDRSRNGYSNRMTVVRR